MTHTQRDNKTFSLVISALSPVLSARCITFKMCFVQNHWIYSKTAQLKVKVKLTRAELKKKGRCLMGILVIKVAC